MKNKINYSGYPILFALMPIEDRVGSDCVGDKVYEVVAKVAVPFFVKSVTYDFDKGSNKNSFSGWYGLNKDNLSELVLNKGIIVSDVVTYETYEEAKVAEKIENDMIIERRNNSNKANYYIPFRSLSVSEMSIEYVDKYVSLAEETLEGLELVDEYDQSRVLVPNKN